MSIERCEKGTGAPSFCWHCGKRLVRAKGVGKGLFYFRRVQDADGAIYRVHGECADLSGATPLAPEWQDPPMAPAL